MDYVFIILLFILVIIILGGNSIVRITGCIIIALLFITTTETYKAGDDLSGGDIVAGQLLMNKNKKKKTRTGKLDDKYNFLADNYDVDDYSSRANSYGIDREDFTVVDDLQRDYVREMPSYSNYTQYDPQLRGFNDRFVRKQLHTGRAPATINRGAAKNRINYARQFYEEDMEYNDRTDWWNEDRTYYTDREW